MSTVFRRAVPDDAPDMARLVASAWKKAYRGILSDEILDGINVEMRGQRMRNRIEADPDFWFYVLEAENEIVGVAGLCSASDDGLPDVGEIMIFYIRPDKQGQGFGKLMMTRALDTLHAMGYTHNVLWVLKENHSARTFYEAMGFTLDGAEKIVEHLGDAPEVRYQNGGA
ncbi:MAG TPA: GNAT family N-acetyltransferase [Candidatus Limiplasma sp.]|nr:GNAT family N-acetyltransferase [Candidatus Limiplasma sp.]